MARTTWIGRPAELEQLLPRRGQSFTGLRTGFGRRCDRQPARELFRRLCEVGRALASLSRCQAPSLTHIAQVCGGWTIKNLVNAKLRPGLA
jgi:hypothetical protein